MSLTVDLFCGAGGLSLGLAASGHRVAAAMDSWAAAVRTYNLNLGGASLSAVGPGTDLGRAELIAGGPPCQGFSSAGARREVDPRNSLVRVFAELVARSGAAAFLFENVEGFLTGGGGRFVLDLLEPVVAAGYRVSLAKLNAANYGVPQHRKRVIAVGGLGFEPSLPEATHSAWGAPGCLSPAGLPPAPTVAESLAGLPPAEANGAGDHGYRPLSGDALERARLLKPGGRMRDLPKELRHGSYGRRANRRVSDGTAPDRRGGAPAGVRRLAGDEPSKAVTGGAAGELLHPEEDRPLTLRECARLQGFPDGFMFDGTKSEQARLVGNAVPPPLAAAVAATLAGASRRARAGRPGALVAFSPTASSAMSPALARVCDMVPERLGGDWR